MRAQVEALKRERRDLIEKARLVLKSADDAGRAMNGDEQAQFDRMHADAKAKSKEATELEKRIALQEEAEADLGTSTGRRSQLRIDRKTDPNAPIVLRLGKDHRGRARTLKLRPGTAEHRRCQPEFRRGFSEYLRTGNKPQSLMQTDVATSGGFLAPETFNAELIKELDDVLWMRQISRKFLIDTPSMGTPYRSARVTSAARGTEVATPTSDTTFAVGKRSLTPSYITGEVDVSRDLRRSAAMNVDDLVNEEIRIDVGYLEESEFMIGIGAALQALGIFVASNDGIPTSRDVTGAFTDQIDADVLRTCKYKLRQQYRMSKSLSWVGHRDTVAQLSKLKSGSGEYLWEAGLRMGDPDLVLGVPFRESEYAPNTYTTGSYVLVLGDFNYYWIVDGMGLEIQVLLETGAKANKDEIVYRRKMDAAPVLGDAFARVKLA